MIDAERKPYNAVYEKIVLRDDDLVGLIAYALYKQNKRDWLISQRQRTSAPPTEAELDAYLTAQLLDGTVLMYRERAEKVLNDFGEEILKRATPEIQRSAIAGTIESSLRWYRQIPAGMASALTYTLLLILIAVALRYAGIDLLGILSSLR